MEIAKRIFEWFHSSDSVFLLGVLIRRLRKRANRPVGSLCNPHDGGGDYPLLGFPNSSS